MPREVLLNVLLPRNRNRPGRIQVEVNGTPQGEFFVLGRGSTTVNGRLTGNPTRSPFGYAGDTPIRDGIEQCALRSFQDLAPGASLPELAALGHQVSERNIGNKTCVSSNPV